MQRMKARWSKTDPLWPSACPWRPRWLWFSGAVQLRCVTTDRSILLRLPDDNQSVTQPGHAESKTKASEFLITNSFIFLSHRVNNSYAHPNYDPFVFIMYCALHDRGHMLFVFKYVGNERSLPDSDVCFNFTLTKQPCSHAGVNCSSAYTSC